MQTCHSPVLTVLNDHEERLCTLEGVGYTSLNFKTCHKNVLTIFNDHEERIKTLEGEAFSWLEFKTCHGDFETEIDLHEVRIYALETIKTYPTLNDVATVGFNLSGGNLTATSAQGGAWNNWSPSTLYNTAGKWYLEITCGALPQPWIIGIADGSQKSYPGIGGGYAFTSGGNKVHNNSFVAHGPSFANTDVLGIAIDFDAGKIWSSKNDVWVGDPEAGTGEAYSGIASDDWYIECASNGASGVGTVITFNFGESAFSGTVPTGFHSGFYKIGV